MKKVAFHPEAEAELLAAASFYETHAPKLGISFLEEVERGLAKIAESPDRWPILTSKARRFLLRRFPFGIVYAVRADLIVVLAVMHLHRRPNYWRDRSWSFETRS
ncbi:MAG: type II toxin-antitoxin system RelE/ParE family toxin [Bacteroidota bacterium]